MERIKVTLLLIFSLIFIFISETILQSAVPLVEIGKVENSYVRGKNTIVSIKVNTKLPIAMMVYISKEFPAVVGDMYNEEEGFYFYEATISGKGEIKPGEIVYTIGERKGTEVYLKLEKYREVFSPKKQGQVISAHKEKVHIDRGSLHEVRERDIYAIYSADGKLKAKIETSAIGDRESVSKIYSEKGIKIDPGDRVVHLGQRKFFGLGVAYITPIKETSPEEKEQGFEKAISPMGGGILWSWTFPNGWGIQWLWGTYFGWWNERGYITTQNHYPNYTVDKNESFQHTLNMYYSFPLLVRKNFFYPGWFSPYLGVELGIFSGDFVNEHTNHYTVHYSTGSSYSYDEMKPYNQGKIKGTPVLVPVIGIELFTSKMLHFFIAMKYFDFPAIVGKEEKHKYKNWVVTLGFTTNW